MSCHPATQVTEQDVCAVNEVWTMRIHPLNTQYGRYRLHIPVDPRLVCRYALPSVISELLDEHIGAECVILNQKVVRRKGSRVSWSHKGICFTGEQGKQGKQGKQGEQEEQRAQRVKGEQGEQRLTRLSCRPNI